MVYKVSDVVDMKRAISGENENRKPLRVPTVIIKSQVRRTLIVKFFCLPLVLGPLAHRLWFFIHVGGKKF